MNPHLEPDIWYKSSHLIWPMLEGMYLYIPLYISKWSRNWISKILPKVTQPLTDRPVVPKQAWFPRSCAQHHHLLPFKTLPSMQISTTSVVGKAGRRENRLAGLCIKHALCFLRNFRGYYTHLTMSLWNE